MPEGWSPYGLKPVPGILIQTCCLSTSYVLIRVSITDTVSKEWWEGLQFPTIMILHCYIHNGILLSYKKDEILPFGTI